MLNRVGFVPVGQDSAAAAIGLAHVNIPFESLMYLSSIAVSLMLRKQLVQTVQQQQQQALLCRTCAATATAFMNPLMKSTH